jgi:multidrug efflux pump subunit AcrB
MGIFILLVVLFKSYMKPFIVLTTIPLGLFGFGAAFLLHSKPVSFLALIGLVGLAGVIVNSAIVLISYIMRLQEEGGKGTLHEILAYASSMRLMSLVITTLTTIAGFAPTAYGIGGKDEVLSPMTLAMMWGLASGTLLTIVWVPCAYAILEDVNGLFRKIFKKSEK